MKHPGVPVLKYLDILKHRRIFCFDRPSLCKYTAIMPVHTTADLRDSQFAKPAEAAVFLNLSRGMVFKQIAKGEIPARRFGKAVRVPWQWLHAQAALQGEEIRPT